MYKIILALFIFALVFARANVFAQVINKGTEEHARRIEGVDRSELADILDSVLQSNSLSMNNVRFVFDSIDKPIFGWSHGANPKPAIATMYVEHVMGYSINEPGIYPSGIIHVSASGKIIYDDTLKKMIHFEFNSSRHFRVTTMVLKPEYEPSFWDSTAKPILVTLGALAVIALFFLVRG